MDLVGFFNKQTLIHISMFQSNFKRWSINRHAFHKYNSTPDLTLSELDIGLLFHEDKLSLPSYQLGMFFVLYYILSSLCCYFCCPTWLYLHGNYVNNGGLFRDLKGIVHLQFNKEVNVDSAVDIELLTS